MVKNWVLTFGIWSLFVLIWFDLDQIFWTDQISHLPRRKLKFTFRKGYENPYIGVDLNHYPIGEFNCMLSCSLSLYLALRNVSLLWAAVSHLLSVFMSTKSRHQMHSLFYFIDAEFRQGLTTLMDQRVSYFFIYYRYIANDVDAMKSSS